jgi:hypothetical protein
MPYLSNEDRERHAAPRICGDCGQPVFKSYCSRCDEFWETNHTEGCPQASEPHNASTCGGDRGLNAIFEP